MRLIQFITLLLTLANCTSKNSEPYSYKESIFQHRKEINKSFASKSESPLQEAEISSFTSLNFYPIDTSFRITAQVELVTEEPFQMPTTTNRKPWYQKIAIAHFNVNQDRCSLSIYKNIDDPEDDVLFIPFLDESNGLETYGGGRYLDIDSLTNPLILDFNMAYNPYCAYNPDFSCPMPPLENKLNVSITAGEKSFKAY